MFLKWTLAGGTVATRRAKGRVVIVAITAVTFRPPVYVDDEVSCHAGMIVQIGRTSMTVRMKPLPVAVVLEKKVAVNEGRC